MRKYLVILLMGCAAVQAQNTISGLVTDSGMQPIPGVSVFAPDIQKSTVTDAGGKFTMSNLPSGNVRLTFSVPGYQPAQRIVSTRGESVINVTLEETVHQMDEVIVSTAFSKFQTENVVKVEHVKLSSLAQRGAATLSEGISTIPGVSQVSTGLSIGKPVVRGLSGNRVVVYSQGIRLENQQFGDEHGLGVSESGVESVEIIKGPASLLYGSDAIGGVMYFNPEKFANANTFSTDVSQRLMSNTLGSATSLGVKGSSENWKFLLRGSHTAHSDYQTPSKERVTNTRFQESDVKAAVGFSQAAYSGVFRYNGNIMNTGIPDDGLGHQTTSKSPTDPHQEISNHVFTFQNNFFFGRSSLESIIGYTVNDRDEIEDGETELSMKLSTLNYNIQYKFPPAGKFEAILGIQGMSQQNRNSGEEMLIPDAIIDDVGVFSKINFDWNSSSIQAGLRYDIRHIRSDEAGVFGDEGYFRSIDRHFSSLNAALGYKTFLSGFVVRANLATGFRSPNLSELTSNGVHEGTNRFEIGNGHLKTEQAFQADVNIEYKSGHWEFFVNGFVNKIQNYIFIAPTGETIDDNRVFRYVQDDATLYGGEAGLHFHPHPFDFLHFESSFESVTGKRDDGSHLPLIPANSWTNTVRAEIRKIWLLRNAYGRVDVQTFADQRNVDVFESPTGGYTLVNAGIGGTIPIGRNQLFASVHANNLLDRRYVSHLSRLKYDNIRNMGRNIILTLNLTL